MSFTCADFDVQQSHRRSAKSLCHFPYIVKYALFHIARSLDPRLVLHKRQVKDLIGLLIFFGRSITTSILNIMTSKSKNLNYHSIACHVCTLLSA